MLVEHIPEGELPYPPFDVNGWHLIVQTSVALAIQERTLRRLIRVYNRCRTANEYYATVNDLMFGHSGVLAVSGISAIGDSAVRQEEDQKFNAHRQVMMDRLLDRAKELEPHLAEALTMVSEELAAAPG